jgi:hypothetical protein
MVHHIRVLIVAKLWNLEAVRVSQTVVQALTNLKLYARPAAMKRGLTVYGRVQARTKTILDKLT